MKYIVIIWCWLFGNINWFITDKFWFADDWPDPIHFVSMITYEKSQIYDEYFNAYTGKHLRYWCE